MNTMLIRSVWTVVVLVAWTTLPVGLIYSQSSVATVDVNHQNVTEAGTSGDVVVVGRRPVIVNGRVARCRPRSDDPLDKVDLRSIKGLSNWGPIPRYMTIVPDGKSGFVWEQNREQRTGPDYWQRVGVSMGNYVFRSSSYEEPMCIGGQAGPYSFAGFRKIVDAKPYHGQRLRFTAWVATRRAGQVSFWLASESMINTKNGGNTNDVPFGGDHLWTPVLLETGPIKNSADRLSYGFNLQGSGDVWIYHPRLEVLEADQWDGNRKDRIVVGVGKGF